MPCYLSYSAQEYVFSLIFSIFLLSLAGIPPLAGFLAKYYVFAAAIKQASLDVSQSWLYWLVGVGLLTSVFSLYYYANVIKQMFFTGDVSPYKIKLSLPSVTVLTISVIGVFLFGIYPEPLLQFAMEISHSFGFIAN